MSKTRCPIIQTDYGLMGHPVVICSILHLLWIEKLLNTPQYIGQFPAVAAAVASLANSSLVCKLLACLLCSELVAGLVAGLGLIHLCLAS